MFNKFYVVFFTVFIFSAISYAAAPMTIPEWLEQRIDKETKGLPVDNQIREVSEYTYKGQKVYYLVLGCCDRFDEVLDEKGVMICAPKGGLTGKGDNKCPDFKASAEKTAIILDRHSNK
jgi:hypothetical protein